MNSDESSASPSIVGYQSWRQLLFIHWRVEPALLQSLLPKGLKIETFDGDAWIGLVPFSMERIRPWWAPPVPGISWFLETNVRTYVRYGNGQSGVWFFSLDANQRLAVLVARRFWHLNYQFAELALSVDEFRAEYSGQRPAAETSYQICADLGRDVRLTEAEPGTLEHFLLERYHLIAQAPNGTFLCGQVHHPPYQYRPAKLISLSQTLTDAAGCRLQSDPAHVLFSPGVDVRVSGLQTLPRPSPV